MEYRGIAYEIRAHPEKNQWSWVIHPAAGVSITGKIQGQRPRAEVAAKGAIDRWLKEHPSDNSTTDPSGSLRNPGRKAGVFISGRRLLRTSELRWPRSATVGWTPADIPASPALCQRIIRRRSKFPAHRAVHRALADGVSASPADHNLGSRRRIFANPCLPGEPFVFGSTDRAEGAPEEHRRPVEAGTIRFNAGRNLASRIRTSDH